MSEDKKDKKKITSGGKIIVEKGLNREIKKSCAIITTANSNSSGKRYRKASTVRIISTESTGPKRKP